MPDPITHCHECNEPLVNVGNGSPFAVCPNGHGKAHPRVQVVRAKMKAHQAQLAGKPKATQIAGVKATDTAPFATYALWTIEGQLGIWRVAYYHDTAIEAVDGNRVRRFRQWKECPVVLKESGREG